MTALLAGTDTLYGFLLGEAAAANLTLPPGGVAPPPVIEMLREAMKPVRAVHDTGDWLIVEGAEIVGMVGLLAPADDEGTVKFGYGVAESRQGRGHASRAVALMLKDLAGTPSIRRIVAETGTSNVASQRVLEKNGFVRIGSRVDPEDGDLIVWERP